MQNEVLRRKCFEEILTRMLGKVGFKSLGDVVGKEVDWDSLDSKDYKILLLAMYKARSALALRCGNRACYETEIKKYLDESYSAIAHVK